MQMSAISALKSLHCTHVQQQPARWRNLWDLAGKMFEMVRIARIAKSVENEFRVLGLQELQHTEMQGTCPGPANVIYDSGLCVDNNALPEMQDSRWIRSMNNICS